MSASASRACTISGRPVCGAASMWIAQALALHARRCRRCSGSRARSRRCRRASGVPRAPRAPRRWRAARRRRCIGWVPAAQKTPACASAMARTCGRLAEPGADRDHAGDAGSGGAGDDGVGLAGEVGEVEVAVAVDELRAASMLAAAADQAARRSACAAAASIRKQGIEDHLRGVKVNGPGVVGAVAEPCRDLRPVPALRWASVQGARSRSPRPARAGPPRRRRRAARGGRARGGSARW